MSGIRGNDIDAGNIAVAKDRLTEPLIKVEGMSKDDADEIYETNPQSEFQ